MTLTTDSPPANAAAELDRPAVAALIRAALAYKDFATGSTGYYATGKVTGPTGQMFQVSAQAVLLGSKTGQVELTAPRDQVVDALAELAAALAPKTFSTGRAGHHITARLVIDGQAFQAAVQAVQFRSTAVVRRPRRHEAGL